MRLLRLLPLAALFLVGACDEDGAVKTASLPPLAYVRYVNAVPDMGTLDFKFIDAVEFSPSFANSPFRTIGIYQGARAGTRIVRVFRNPGTSGDITIATQVIITDTLTLVQGTYYTILHAGYTNGANGTAQNIYLLTDTRPDQNTGLHVRGVNAAMGLGGQDFHGTPLTTTTLVGSTPFATNVAVATASNYFARATGAFAVQSAATTTTVSLGAAAPIAGVAGTALVDPVAGSGIAGTQFSAFFFPPSVGALAAPFASSGVVIVADRQPPRTVPD